jgi:predicted transcriptional regulator
MIEIILGSKSKEQILLYISGRNEGYAREIARYYNTSTSPIQSQLDKLEINNVLVSKVFGKTRVYYLNPRYPFVQELKQILDKTISFLPKQEKEKLLMVRKRPRRKGKPL